jgi:hypothetical protein
MLSTVSTLVVSIIGGAVGAYLNNFWQRKREEHKIIRKKGEKALTALTKIKDEHVNFFIKIDNELRLIRQDGAVIMLGDLFDEYNSKTDLRIKIEELHSEVQLLSAIYFPDWIEETENFDRASRNFIGEVISLSATVVDTARTKVINADSVVADKLRAIKDMFDLYWEKHRMLYSCILDDINRSRPISFRLATASVLPRIQIWRDRILAALMRRHLP